jgi:N-acetylglucosaminyldiphosphoundecaprenol N-acetyl-beta-D-mannosaminyltransferase
MVMPSGPLRHPPDFERRLVAILGLPFDTITVAEAVEHIRASALQGRRCFVSTPNLNFAMTARKDPAFRSAVLHSDLSLIDGMPLVWIARLLGLPVPERVSGADVFEALQDHQGTPLSVFVFGGPPGAAAAACARINSRGSGLRCVGFDSGGFGSIDALSTQEHLDRINGSGAHFVVVALGAVKGQAWIERNAAHLSAPVLCHLGAVVNFAAGSLRRAPPWIRSRGFEWAWRIKEEPGLWRRYGHDGVHAVALIATQVLPSALHERWQAARGASRREVRVTRTAGLTTIELHGSWRDDSGRELRRALAASDRRDRLVVDLHAVDQLGAEPTALLLIAQGWFGEGAGFTVTRAGPRVARALRRSLADDLLREAAGVQAHG